MPRTTFLFVAASLLALTVNLPAEAGEANFEIAGGAYVSGTSHLGDEAAFGVRGGYRFTDRWAIQGSLSRTELFDIHTSYLDTGLDATFFDLSAMFFITPNRKAELFVYGGIGMARFDVGIGPIRFDTGSGRVHVPRFGATVDDEFTTHLGLGVNIQLTDRMYLRPDIRSRWLGDFDGGTVDAEPSIGLGWRF